MYHVSFLTAVQVASILAMPESWVYQEWRRYTQSNGRHGLPCKRFGRSVRMSDKQLNEWLERQ